MYADRPVCTQESTVRYNPAGSLFDEEKYDGSFCLFPVFTENDHRIMAGDMIHWIQITDTKINAKKCTDIYREEKVS